MAYTPDGSAIVATAFDGVHVWDARSGVISESYRAQAGPRSLLTLDPSGATAIAGYQDGSLGVFDLRGERRLGRVVTWTKQPEQSCAGPGPCFAINRRSTL